MDVEELKRLFNYDPVIGIFTRLVSTAKNTKIGEPAGSIDSYGYLRIGINKKQYAAHRLAWLYMHGKFPNKQIDHINGIKTDNRICNLREASIAENKRNTGKQINNKSGFKGVCWDKNNKKWVAQCNANGKRVYLGLFETPESAYSAYQHFARIHHGEFFKE